MAYAGASAGGARDALPDPFVSAARFLVDASSPWRIFQGGGVTQAAAKELASDGVTVNAYCPGVVGTDMWKEIDRRLAELTGAKLGENYDKYVGGNALGRAETHEDVAGFVSYLASPDSDYMTGQAIMIDGGLVYR